MKNRPKTHLSVVLLALVIVTVAVAYFVGGRTGPQRVAESGQAATATHTPSYPSLVSPIYYNYDAMDRSLSLFPTEAFSPTNGAARLLTYAALDQWRGGSSPGTESHSPAWLVGIVADGLTVGDVMAWYTQQLPGGHPNPGQPVEGAFYVWDANSGDNMGQGVLNAASPRSFASLSALQGMSLTIEVATLPPPLPTAPPITPGAPTESPP